MQTCVLMAPNLLPLPNMLHPEQNDQLQLTRVTEMPHSIPHTAGQTRRFEMWASLETLMLLPTAALPGLSPQPCLHLISLILAFFSPKHSQIPGLNLLGPEGGRELPRASGHPFN